jgi:hypothetical protein
VLTHKLNQPLYSFPGSSIISTGFVVFDLCRWDGTDELFIIFLPLSESARSVETDERTDQKYQSAYATFHFSA